MTMLDLDELERVGKAATEGPWELFRDDGHWIQSANGRIVGDSSSECLSREQDTLNGTFIVAARNNWDALISEIRRLRQLVEAHKIVEPSEGGTSPGSNQKPC